MAYNKVSNKTQDKDVKYLSTRQLCDDGKLKIERVNSKDNPSDIFTKVTSKQLFIKHRNKMGIKDIKEELKNIKMVSSNNELRGSSRVICYNSLLH